MAYRTTLCMSVLYDHVFSSPRLCAHNGAAIFQRCSVISSTPLGFIAKSETQRARALHCMRPPLNDLQQYSYCVKPERTGQELNFKFKKVAQAAGCPDMK